MLNTKAREFIILLRMYILLHAMSGAVRQVEFIQLQQNMLQSLLLPLFHPWLLLFMRD
jgi:hypothetical protein